MEKINIIPQNMFVVCVNSASPYFTEYFEKTDDTITISFKLTNQTVFKDLFNKGVIVELKYINKDGSTIENLHFQYLVDAIKYNLSGVHTESGGVALLNITYKIINDVT
jgi:hypothetical protein